LATSPDEYFLERARKSLEAEFFQAFPQGELVLCDPPPAPKAFLQELQTPSLFAQERLFLVPQAQPLLAQEEGQGLWEGLPQRVGGIVWVGLFAQLDQEPQGFWASLPWLERLHFALPAAPKPWEELRLSPEQRGLLLQLLQEEVPEILAHGQVVEALLESHGFAPRELVQAAKGLVATGELSPEGARQTVGQAVVLATDLDKALQGASWPALARALAQLATGASLEGFRGEVASGRRAADLVAALFARACLSALTLRLVAEKAGLGQELSPAKVSRPSWYPREFKPRLLPALLKAAEDFPELGLGERSPWALQAAFRVAASFSAEQLVAALAALLRYGGLRAETSEPWGPLVLAYSSLFALSKSS
jgi:hypothetical protein